MSDDEEFVDDEGGLTWEELSCEEQIDVLRENAVFEREDLYPWEPLIGHQRRYIVRYPRPRTMSTREWETRTRRKAAAIHNAVVREDLRARHNAIIETAETAEKVDFDAFTAQLGEVTSELVRKHAERLGCVWFPTSDRKLQELVLADADPVLRETWVDGDGNPLMTVLVATLGEDHKWGAEWTRRDEEYERAKSERRNPNYRGIPLWVD